MIIDTTYRKQPVCRAAMRLVRSVYALTKHFPDDEKSGLTATLKRSAASLPTKLAESHVQADAAASAKALVTAQTVLRECSAYLDVAERLRLTQRWRFRASRRWTFKVARRLSRMLPDEQAGG